MVALCHSLQTCCALRKLPLHLERPLTCPLRSPHRHTRTAPSPAPKSFPTPHLQRQLTCPIRSPRPPTYSPPSLPPSPARRSWGAVPTTGFELEALS